jgi:D-psicose/D-tagatose/L-ribulose 3-epimerase
LIRLGAHCYLFVDRWSDGDLGILDRVKQLGAECFEISVGDDVQFTPSLTRRRAEALELDLTIGPGAYWPPECDLSADDPADRQRGLAWHRKQVALAGEVGAVAYCGALYGHPGIVKRRVPPADEYDRIAESLHELAAYGERSGVAIVLEPMSHFRTHVVNRPEQAVRLVELADHPDLYILLDTFHLVTEVRSYAESVRVVGKRLWGIHASENDRGVPGGGLVPWEAVFGALRETSFDGYVLLETYNSSIGDFAYRRGIFQNVCPDADAFVRQGLAFLRKGLASRIEI